MTIDLKLRKPLAEMVLNDFLKWIREPGRVDSWDQEFFDTWIEKYLDERYHSLQGSPNNE